MMSLSRTELKSNRLLGNKAGRAGFFCYSSSKSVSKVSFKSVSTSNEI